MMPSSSSSALSAAASQKTSQPDLKPMSICLPGNSTLDMSTSTTMAVASSRPSTSATNASFYHSSSSAASPASTTIQGLSVMVARLDTNNRHQTVILQRPGPPITTRANVVVSSSNLTGGSAIRATTMIGQSSVSTTPVTGSSASISVRTTHLVGAPQHQPTTVPVMNLSGVNNSSTASGSHVQKQIFSHRPFPANALPIESVNLVLANTNESNIINARQLRFANDAKSSVTAHTINKNPASQRSANMIASTLVNAGQSQKMINLGPSGANATVSQSIARVGFIGQINAGSTVSSNKSGSIINLATLPKGIILNSTNSNPLHNMVTVSGPVSTIGSTAKLSNATTSNTPTRQVVVTTGTPFGPHTTGNTSAQHNRTPQLTGAAATNSLQASQSVLQASTAMVTVTSTTTTTTTSSSPLRPTILSPANSPIKQSQMQLTTPSSPRPSILIRKRIANDTNAQGNATSSSTTIFKTSNSPLRGAIIALNSTEPSHSTSAHASHEPRVDGNDVQQSNSVVSAPTTPNSEGVQTPRKKPRKQLLEPFTLKSSQNMQLLNSDLKLKDECHDKDSCPPVNNNKRPRATLLSAYSMPWKALQFHFLRYSDVKPKPEKKLTLSELSNEGLQRKNGWKIHHLATQMELMSDNEACVNERLSHFLETFERDASSSSANNSQPNSTANSPLSSAAPTVWCAAVSGASSDKNKQIAVNSNNLSVDAFDANCIAEKLSDLIRGNLQRSNLFTDQINEARHLVVKLTNEHKERVGKITKKCANKRTYITK